MAGSAYRQPAGKLDKRITLQTKGSERDAAGHIRADQWSDTETVWASIEPLSGSEFFEGERQKNTVTHRIRLRYIEPVNPRMRIRYGSRIFQISSVLNPQEKNKLLECMCKEVT